MAGFGAQKIKKARKTPDTRTKRRNAVYYSVLSVRNGCPKGVRAGHLRRTAANNSSGWSYKCANLAIGLAFCAFPSAAKRQKSLTPKYAASPIYSA